MKKGEKYSKCDSYIDYVKNKDCEREFILKPYKIQRRPLLSTVSKQKWLVGGKKILEDVQSTADKVSSDENLISREFTRLSQKTFPGVSEGISSDKNKQMS